MRARILWLLMPLLLAAVAPAGAAQFAITTSGNAGGTVSPKGKVLVNQGGTQDVTFQANVGYYLAKVTVNKTPVDPGTDPKTFTYHFTDVQQNNTIAGTFAKDPTVTVSTTAGGAITPPWKVSVPFGTNKIFSIQANAGYHLQDVLVDSISHGADLSSWEFDNVRENHTLKAVFAINTYSVTASPSPGGKILPAALTAKYLQKVTLTATPDTGMMLSALTVNEVPVPGLLPTTKPYKLIFPVTSDTTVAAIFTESRPSAGLLQLQGTYNIVSRNSSFGMSSGGGNTYVGENLSGDLITGTFDGKGGCSIKVSGSNFSKGGDGSGNDTVTVSADTNSPTTCTYSITNGSAFTLNLVSSKGPETVNGWVSVDGNTLITGGPSQKSYDSGGGTDYRVETVTGVKAGSGMTKSSLAGTYHLVSQEASFWKSVNGGQTYVSDNLNADNITATFDGSGGCIISNTGTSFQIQGDGSGNQFVSASSDTNDITGCTYTVTAAGVFTLNMVGSKGTETVSGWASADGNAVVVGGPSQKSDTGGTGYRAELTFGVRSGSGLDNSALSGTYQLIGASLEYYQSSGVNPSSVSKNIHGNMVSPTSVSKNISGHVITASFDGSGGCAVNSTDTSYQIQNNGSGDQVFTSSEPNDITSCTYTVDAEGVFTLNMEGSKGTEVVSGWASADGNTVVLGGPSQKSDQGGTGYRVELTIGTRILPLALAL
jgi:hypothetical protein